MRRVVVTGLGIVSPLGCQIAHVWPRLLDGAIGVTLQRTAATDYAAIPCKVAAPVPRGKAAPHEFNEDAVSTNAERRYLSNGFLFGLHAAEQALRDAELLLDGKVQADEAELERTGVCLGFAMNNLQDTVDAGDDLRRGYSKLSPFFMPKILPNLGAGQISIKYGFQGPNHCVSTACATGLHAVGDAFRFIQHNDADVMVCGGAEASISPLGIAAFARMRALSTKFTDTPERSSRPFDRDRDGFVMGEGSGVLILEEYEHAKRRGAKMYAEVLGYGLAGDASHMTTPRDDGKGATLCMNRALGFAGVKPEQVGYVNCHATSTPHGDKAEANAVRKVFGADKLISSTKGATGHLLGAAGAIESIFAVLACHSGSVPPTVNLENVDKDISDLNIVANKSVKWEARDRRIAIKNSFGFGGTNASIVFAQIAK
ncbi:3-oxoacyl-[acyl-carrier-protein] synthase, mitochondrial [Hypsibius exemplaris]|uniref:3-oxoacyl-[acyl-carrier-protein] synthase n=1 Tax=Hypsibius exemplaris TaxID=2072580 RepID=A0A1W0X3P8_HYPEX|nr:3-oxoacyl-[acyl-carrier-protein] synthase, mitochondrial [Hypsibius exemplaris]